MGLWEDRVPELFDMLYVKRYDLASIATIYGVNLPNLKRRVQELIHDGKLVPPNQTAIEVEIGKSSYKESNSIESDGTYKSDKLLRMSAEQSKDPVYLLEAHGFDPQAWELINAKNNIWNVYSKVDKVQTLYSSKITVKPRAEEFTVEDARAFFNELAATFKSPIHVPTRYSHDGKMLEINIADLHLGKLCWDGDSGETYNEEIARERFFYIINDVLSRTRMYDFSKIIFVWSNDYFHYDTTTVTTTAGTRQDSNLRWQKMYKLGLKMLIEAIDLLSQFAPVETFYVGANHDKMMSYFATEHVAAWFRSNPNVIVDIDPMARKYKRFGKCLIGFSHGNSEGKRLGKLMPIEAREDWGQTIYHEFHSAHLHLERKVDEDNGVIVRVLSSPTGTDNWHYEAGFVGAVKKSQSFVWDVENGLELIINTPILLDKSTISNACLV